MKIEGVAELIRTAVEGVFQRMLGTKVAALGFFWDVVHDCSIGGLLGNARGCVVDG